jgi:hypothetical protein
MNRRVIQIDERPLTLSGHNLWIVASVEPHDGELD